MGVEDGQLGQEVGATCHAQTHDTCQPVDGWGGIRTRTVADLTFLTLLYVIGREGGCESWGAMYSFRYEFGCLSLQRPLTRSDAGFRRLVPSTLRPTALEVGMASPLRLPAFVQGECVGIIPSGWGGEVYYHGTCEKEAHGSKCCSGEK